MPPPGWLGEGMDATDVFRCLSETIEARLQAGGAGPGEEGEPDRRRLEADCTTVRLHSRIADQPVTYGEASFCRECGEPAPCTVIRDLAEVYGCDG